MHEQGRRIDESGLATASEASISDMSMWELSGASAPVGSVFEESCLVLQYVTRACHYQSDLASRLPRSALILPEQPQHLS
jgi:hypothetical protein